MDLIEFYITLFSLTLELSILPEHTEYLCSPRPDVVRSSE